MGETKGRRIILQPRAAGAPVIRRVSGAPGEIDGTMAQAGFYRCRGIAILQARLAVNATQDALADALGVNQTTISRMQNSQAFMDQDAAERLAGAFATLAQANRRPAPDLAWRRFVDIPDGATDRGDQGDSMAARAATA